MSFNRTTLDLVQFETTTIASTSNKATTVHVDYAGLVWLGGALVTSPNVSIVGQRYTAWGGTIDAFSVLYDENLEPLWEPDMSWA